MSAEDLLISVPAAALWATENRTINFPAERLGPAPCSSLLRDCIKIQYLRNRTSTQIHWILPFYKSRYVHIQRRFCRCMSCCLLELYVSQSVCFFLKNNIFPQFFIVTCFILRPKVLHSLMQNCRYAPAHIYAALIRIDTSCSRGPNEVFEHGNSPLNMHIAQCTAKYN